METKIFDFFLHSNVSSVEALNSLIDEQFQYFEEYYYSGYEIQEEQRDGFESFVLFKHSIIAQLDYSQLKNRSFVLMLLDLCERHGIYSCVPHLVCIIEDNSIIIDSRIKAGLCFINPAPRTNSELVAKLLEVCDLLQKAYEEEEDNEYNVLVTLLNFFDKVFYDTNSTYSNKLLSEYRSIKANYSFLNSLSIEGALTDVDADTAHSIIQDYIAGLFRKKIYQPAPQQHNYIIEVDTDYAEALNEMPADFMQIRKYCVEHADGNLDGRGVSMLSKESEMFEYIKRFGRMHYAKIESALASPFPQHFDGKISLIDWGCGQALATMAFIEKYGNDCIDRIVLIEPSEIVLKRAALHSKKFAPNAKIYTVCKKLDDVNVSDINIGDNVVVHLFSNILDIDDYSVSHLANNVDGLMVDKNYFVCASPYISDIKSAKIQSFVNCFRDRPTFRMFHDIENTKQGKFWACNNSYGKFSFSHGDGYGCGDYDSNGCYNKWTRVLKVFTV